VARKKEYLIYKLSDEMKSNIRIDAALFNKLDVKRGLRNEDGTGVLVGLTNVGDVVGYERTADGALRPIDGRLYYCSYDMSELAHAAMSEHRFGFEEVAYLLLSGRLPGADELAAFRTMTAGLMPLQQKTILNIIELEGRDIMNILARSTLELYTFDPTPDDLSRDNLMRQSVELLSKFPTIIAYAYNVFRHKEHGRTLHLRHPQPNLSLAENFLFMLKGTYTELEARTLDLLMMVHAEHGGGNNSTFTVRVTSSTGTDTYSAIAAGIGSLKGPKHGGANIKVCAMMKHLMENISDWEDNDEISRYLDRILRREAFDKTGLIYGIGHAVYTLSDPRAVLLKEMAAKLAEEKGRLREFAFLERVEHLAVEAIYRAKGDRKKLCANVDFYSGFVYDLIGLPEAIYTPLFAMSRIVGWCAHRNEELNFDGRRIIRPAYRCVSEVSKFIPLTER